MKRSPEREKNGSSNNKQKGNRKKNITDRKLTAVAVILQLLEIPVPFMPTFIKFDFSDLPAILGAFSMGPVCGILIEFLKNLIHVKI